MARSTTLKIDIIADGAKAESGMSRVSRAAKGLAIGVAAGVATAVVAIGALAIESIKAASKVEQSFGAIDAVFGKHSDKVKGLATDAALKVGLAKSEYADLAVVLGSQLRNAGTSIDQLAPKTDKLIGLGADLAAQFGGSTADAVAAVSSLLKGESDPIEKYGVSIKKSDINARLASQGLGKLTGAALKQAEANAALTLLTEQTATAQGAFAREGGTAANSSQKLGAILENVQATIGAALLPALATLATWVISTVVPAVERLAAQLGPVLTPILGQLASFITGTAGPTLTRLATLMSTQVAPTVSALGRFISTVLLPPILGLASFVTGTLVPALASALGPALSGARNMLGQVQAAVERNRPALDKLGAILKTVATFVVQTVAPALGGILKTSFEVLGRVIGATIDTISSLVDALSKAWTWVGKLVDKIANSGVGKLIGGVASAIGGVFGSAAQGAVVLTQPLALSAAAGGGGPGGALGRVNVQAGATDVRVYIGEREITDLVQTVVGRTQRAQALRVAAGVRA